MRTEHQAKKVHHGEVKSNTRIIEKTSERTKRRLCDFREEEGSSPSWSPETEEEFGLRRGMPVGEVRIAAVDQQ